MARPPHEIIHERARWEIEYDAQRAALEAKYGVPYEKLPEILRYPPPEHPQHGNPRRFDYVSLFGRRYNARSRSSRRLILAGRDQLGWRTRREHYLDRVEKFRQAEIAVRKLRTKRTGRGKPLDRKAHVHARERIDAREWRDEL
jgi:hypothetical protein